MSSKTKAILIAVLSVAAVALVALVWIQTKALVITVGLLLVSLAALYVVVRVF